MKAIVHHANGGPEVLALVDVGADFAGVVEAGRRERQGLRAG